MAAILKKNINISAAVWPILMIFSMTMNSSPPNLMGYQHTHTCFAAHCLGIPVWACTRRDIHPLTRVTYCGSLSLFWILWGVGKMIGASSPTIQLEATQSGPSMHPFLSSPSFMPKALPVATLPVYPGLGQAPSQIYWIVYLQAWLRDKLRYLTNCLAVFDEILHDDIH